MSAGENVHGGTFAEVVETVFGAVDRVLVVAPTARALETLIADATTDSGPTVRVLADPSVLKEVTTDFVMASTAADGVASGRLSIRSGETGTAASLVVADGAVWVLVATADRVAALGDDDAAFVDAAASTYETRWEAASPFEFRTPSLSRIRETLAAEIGEGARADFDAALDAITTVQEGDSGFDEVMLTLLVAARNDVLLYDISKWGEDVGIASKATFSRTKTTLEDEGLIETEKVPIDIGRPRLRLKLNEELFDDATPMELAAVTLNHSG
jgi:hypothetical protein